MARKRRDVRCNGRCRVDGRGNKEARSKAIMRSACRMTLAGGGVGAGVGVGEEDC